MEIALRAQNSTDWKSALRAWAFDLQLHYTIRINFAFYFSYTQAFLASSDPVQTGIEAVPYLLV